jgi:GNAT superfamily N-acetyltransferase
VEVELRDGSWVQIRQIHPNDKGLLLAAFNRLSPESRYRRFLTPMPSLGPSQLAYLTEVDHHDHEAVIAIDMLTGDGVGVGRFVREPGSDRAEAAVTVADEWQGRGLGGALTRVLAGRAVQEGIAGFTALLLAGNAPITALLEEIGSVRVRGREGEAVLVDVPLATGLAEDPALRGVLRAVASTPIEMARAPGGSAPGRAG